jgi:DNA helicase-2/ATP-dependent DNA helicase PcrA
MNYEGGSSYGYSNPRGGGGGWQSNKGGWSRGGGASSATPTGPGGSGRAAQLGAHDSGFKVGQTVNHARFGQGVIVGLEGSGEDARAQIQFKRDGVKWLALAVAKLEAV